MKKIILFFTLSLGLTLSSCGDTCKDIMCGDNTICEEGVCNCLPDFEKNNKGICVSTLVSDRDKFVGNWNVTENCSFFGDTFNSFITKHLSIDDQLIISNLSERYTVYAIMISSSEFEIPFQISGNTSIIGSGSYVGSTMIVDYTIEALPGSSGGSGSISCNATYTK
jgi:hypothetical protein